MSISSFRRLSASVLLTVGLVAGGSTVASAGSTPAPATVSVIGLQKGDTGPAVKALQEALIRVGIGVVHGVDSYFGSATQSSVKALQRMKGLPITGVVDAATAAALGLAAPAAAPAAAAPAAASNGSLARGARGDAVRRLQQSLTAAGVTVAGGVDGIFGTATEAAVKTFQQARGLPATGVADASTLGALQGGGGSAPRAVSSPPGAVALTGLRLGHRSTSVVALQQALINLGYSIRLGANGIFGTDTQNAVMQLQQRNGVAATGVVDAKSAAVLAGAPAAAPAAAAATPASAAAPAANGFATYDERGQRVVALQQALINAGIAVRGGADGVFGSATAAAVMAFQRAKGLPVSGKVDAATAGALGLTAGAPPAAAPAVTVQLEAKPVQGPCFYGDTWNAARGNGRVHLGVDIGAKEGNAVYAAISGTVSQVYSEASDALAGNGLKIRRPDGTYIFYAHLLNLAPEIAVGAQVGAGQVVGALGKTGNAGVPHLHIEVHPLGGAAINPYPVVKAIGAC